MTSLPTADEPPLVLSSVLSSVPPIVPPVDALGLESRARAFARRAIVGSSRARALERLVGLLDLTTLEGADTDDSVRRLCARAARPGAGLPPVAAVCVYPPFVALARRELADSPVAVAAVATAFPSGQSFLDIRLAEVAGCVAAGADEIDMVLSRTAFLAGDHGRVHDEIAAVRDACGGLLLKVILETGELGGYDDVRLACQIALAAGADFLKTSTGKLARGATLPVTLVLLSAVRDHVETTGRAVGVKPAGGLRRVDQVLPYLVAVKETLGDRWLTDERLRFGASSLLDDVLRERRRAGAA